ncbi:MAG: hypothetical protein M1827_007180 [Pycnora praestabilis]|nr:MAG: hypothetical protein M1827_007180 [Pycnora praestabilis]
MTVVAQGLPASSSEQTYVSVHALSAGFLTLPEHLFVQPSKPENRKTVPSLSFLIQHQPTGSDAPPTRVVFDLGLRRDPDGYIAPIRKHILTRQPMTTVPDVTSSLAEGQLRPEDIDYVFLSHVHWDHVGTPSDFTTSKFIVGHGSIKLLQSGGDTSTGGHAHFESDLLPLDRTIELSPTSKIHSNGTNNHISNGINGDGAIGTNGHSNNGISGTNGHTSSSQPSRTTDLSNAQWHSLAHFPHAIDFFFDGSLYIIDAPGHLQGHINLLARTGPQSWVYLGGDACHDRRLLRGDAEIAEWEGPHGGLCSIHVDKMQTERTMERIRFLEGMRTRGEGDRLGVEVILAHDVEWSSDERNKDRFWPGKI